MAKKEGVEKAPACPISLADFSDHAKQLPIKIGDETKLCEPKVFSTGSFGWYLGEKCTVMVGGVALRVQIGLNLIVVGSKDAPEK